MRGSGVAPISIAYAAAGTCTVTLVVTDNNRGRQRSSDAAGRRCVDPTGVCDPLYNVNNQLIMSGTWRLLANGPLPPEADSWTCSTLQIVPTASRTFRWRHPSGKSTRRSQPARSAGRDWRLSSRSAGSRGVTPRSALSPLADSVGLLRGASGRGDFNTVRVAYYADDIPRWVTLINTTPPANGQVCISGLTLSRLPLALTVFGANLPE